MTPGCDPHAAAEMLRALAHPMRLAILCRLLDGEAAVSAFENELGLRQPSLSQQLSYLREAGLVATQKVSKAVIYRLTDSRVRPIVETVRATFSADGTVRSNATVPRDAGAPAAACPAGRKPVIAGCGVFSSAGWART